MARGCSSISVLNFPPLISDEMETSSGELWGSVSSWTESISAVNAVSITEALLTKEEDMLERLGGLRVDDIVLIALGAVELSGGRVLGDVAVIDLVDRVRPGLLLWVEVRALIDLPLQQGHMRKNTLFQNSRASLDFTQYTTKMNTPCAVRMTVNAHSNITAKVRGIPLDAGRPRDHPKPNSTDRTTATQKFSRHF